MQSLGQGSMRIEMKRFLTMTIATGLAISLASVAFGQAAGPGKGTQGGTKPPQGGQQGQRQGGTMMRMGGNRMNEIQTKILTQVGATADQKNKVAALNKKRDADMKAKFEKMRASGKQPDRETMRKEFEGIQKAYNASLAKILGKDKYAKYDKLMKAEIEKMRKEREKNGGNRPPQGGKTGGKTPPPA